MRVWLGLMLALVLGAPVGAAAQDTAASLRAVMEKSVSDWNRGDLAAFSTCYKDSPEILFIGKRISRGYAEMVATYKKNFASREQMGTLSFTQLEPKPLDEHFATMTGRFHVERTPAGGGNLDGYFLLVFENTKDGWKIIEDDSTYVTKPAA